jgi:hypothetical protein
MAFAVTNPPPHWAFQPITEPAVPVLAAIDAGVTHPVDAFIRTKLGERGLEPAASADRRTLLRRLTFVLNGLPPTPGEIAAFLADDAPGAFERVTDRWWVRRTTWVTSRWRTSARFTISGPRCCTHWGWTTRS